MGIKKKLKNHLKDPAFYVLIVFMISFALLLLVIIPNIMLSFDLYELPEKEVRVEEYGLITDIVSYDTSSGFLSESTGCVLELNSKTKISISGKVCNNVIANHSILIKKHITIKSKLTGEINNKIWYVRND